MASTTTTEMTILDVYVKMRNRFKHAKWWFWGIFIFFVIASIVNPESEYDFVQKVLGGIAGGVLFGYWGWACYWVYTTGFKGLQLIFVFGSPFMAPSRRSRHLKNTKEIALRLFEEIKTVNIQSSEQAELMKLIMLDVALFLKQHGGVPEENLDNLAPLSPTQNTGQTAVNTSSKTIADVATLEPTSMPPTSTVEPAPAPAPEEVQPNQLSAAEMEKLSKQALAYLKQEKSKESMALLKQVLSQNPKYVPALLVLGHAMRQQNRIDEACKYYKRAAQLGSKNARKYLEKIDCSNT